jgi:predicted anti-sigma-YlaC factor YlaD
MMVVIPRSCERARGWASLSLDGELSEFEELLLRTHVAKCPACAAFQEDVRALTAQLRDAPLVPAPSYDEATVERRRYSRQHVVRAAASFAAVLVVVSGSVAVMKAPSSGSPHDPRARVPKPSESQLLAERLNWQGGLPTVKPSQKGAYPGQRPGTNPTEL